jgi:hypothetical protein
MEVLATVGMAIAVVSFVFYLVIVESRRLGRAAQHLRELEREGLAEADLIDQLPEFSAAPMKILLPDGTEVDARQLLHDELDHLRAYGPNRTVPRGRGSGERSPRPER